MAYLLIVLILSVLVCYVGMRAERRFWLELLKSDLKTGKITSSDYLDYMEFIDAEFSLIRLFSPRASKIIENYTLKTVIRR